MLLRNTYKVDFIGELTIRRNSLNLKEQWENFRKVLKRIYETITHHREDFHKSSIINIMFYRYNRERALSVWVNASKKSWITLL